MRDGFQEVRFSLRRLAASPGFTLAAVLTLALGIGANAAIYSLVNAVVLKPLPYREAGRLVTLWHSAPGAEITHMDTSFGVFEHYDELSRALDDLVMYQTGRQTLTADGPPRQLATATVSEGFFEMLLDGGPMRGRLPVAADHAADRTLTVLISHRLWQQRYGGDESLVGRTVMVDGTPRDVIGVLPMEFGFPSLETDLWMPMYVDPARVRIGTFNKRTVGRLAPGVTPDEALAELRALVPRLHERFPGNPAKAIVDIGQLTPHLLPLRDRLLGGFDRTLWILLGAVGVVLLIACANVANLFLVRADGRTREMAVRAALGAGRGGILRHYLVEAALLGALGGAAGLLLAQIGLATLVRLGPQNIPRLHEVGLDASVLAFTVGLSIVAGLLFGALPMLRRGAVDLAATLRDGSRGMTAGRERHRTASVLVASQIAFALTLLVGAGLMARSFARLADVDPGFDAAGALTFRVSLPWNEYESVEDGARMQQSIIDRIAEIPGVAAAGAVTCLPLQPVICTNVNPLLREGMEVGEHEMPPAVERRIAAPGYFHAMGIPLVAGRTFERGDHEQASGAVVVSRSLAERFWPDRDAIGRRVFPTLRSDPNWYTIVGIVEDVHEEGLMQRPQGIAYFAMVGKGDNAVNAPQVMDIVVRTDGPPLGLIDPVRAAVRELDPNLPLAGLRPLTSLVTEARAPMAFAMLLLAIAAAVALCLGFVGVYGVLSYGVSQREKEIGVRMALGARGTDIVRLILGRGLGVATVGVVAGLVGAFGLTRVMRSLLFDVRPTDPATYTVVTLALFAVAAFASWLPARRAARQDPLRSLRAD